MKENKLKKINSRGKHCSPVIGNDSNKIIDMSDVKNPIEEALKKSSDEVLAKVIQDLLKKDMLH